MKSLAQARLKRARAVELFAEGMSYDEVAKAVGYGHRGSAHRAVSTALAAREVNAVDGHRALELARLDCLQVALWDEAMEGDARAAMLILRIIDQRVRLLGLLPGLRRADQAGLSHLVVGAAEGNQERQQSR